MLISDWISDVFSSDLQWLGFTTTEAFDATRHRVRLLERRRGIDQRHATADQCTECRQQVVDIEAAEQAAADRRATQMTVDDKRNALSVKCQLTRDQMRQVRRLTFNAIRNDIDAAALGGNPFAADRKSTRLNSSH